MPKTRLTTRFVGSVQPTSGKQVDYYDATVKGFVLRVSPGGKKTWGVFYRRGRSNRRLTLGDFPRLGLADARQRAREALSRIALGGDPAVDRAADRKAMTFSELSTSYLDLHACHKRSGREDARIIRVELLPQWRRLLAKEITRRDVRELLRRIADRPAPIMANRTLALVRKMFNFAIEEELVRDNPAQRVKRPAPERPRDRVLSEDEIRTVWSALESESAVISSAIRLMLLTAQRSGEVLSMQWVNVDLLSGWWTIPSDRSKNGQSHRVPLSEPARRILLSLREEEASSPWVFRSPRGKEPKPVEHIQKAVERIRNRAGVEFRGHDLRRTAASLMVGSGVPRLVVSKILNHAESGVTSVYDRHSYDPEKRAALEQWARTLDAILKKRQKRAAVIHFSRG